MSKQTIVLVILDGWGIGRADASNPVHTANPKNINFVKHNYPIGSLQASGIAVGLPWNEEGNSEVGHLTLGAGKIIYQHFPRISLSVKDGSFFKNQPILDAITHVKKNNSEIHFVGLLTDSGVHAHIDHLQALLRFAERENLSRVNLHLFTDGKDTPPKSALKLIKEVPQEKVASISGRFFAMDRDLHWDRTTRVYDTLVNPNVKIPISKQNPNEFLASSYSQGLTDNFVPPTLFNPEGVIKDNDSVVFFNFREDAMRQLVEMFIDPLAGEKHEIPKNLHITTFTEYSEKFDLLVAFPAEKVVNTLGKVLADNNKIQLRVAETEKYAHITYFFNGFREEPYKNEYRVLIPSRSVARPDEYPEMMAGEITTRVVSALAEKIYDFILVNYANPDVIAHTGNFNAGVKAVSVVDDAVGALVKAALDGNHTLIITSDHGNIERMIDPRTGHLETKHDTNQVPAYLIQKGRERPKSDAAIQGIESSNTGVLSDITPTILHLMGLPTPNEMTGVNLVDLLQ